MVCLHVTSWVHEVLIFYTSTLAWTNQQIRVWAGCYCAVLVTPLIKTTLNPPIAPYRTLQDTNKGTKVCHCSFFLCKTSENWKGFWQPLRLVSCLESPWRALLHCRKTPLLLVAIPIQNVFLKTHLCLLLSLLIAETSFLRSTILHWTQRQSCLGAFAFIFNTISCVYWELAAFLCH